MSAPDSPPIPGAVHDPTVTRLIPVHVPLASGDRLPAAVAGRGSAERRAEAAVTTSVSVVIVHQPAPDDGGRSDRGRVALAAALAALSAWSHPQLRLELLVVGRPDDPDRPAVREMLSSSGCSWRLLDAPRGGRAAMLGLAAEQAEHEFVVVAAPGGPSPFRQVRAALALMWSEGGDAALVEERDPDEPGQPDQPDQPDQPGPSDPSGAPPVDASASLVAWLGLDAPPQPGRVVILRRWAGRWLFNEVTRAISPAEEVADRARLLGIGIVHLVGEGPAGAQSD